MIKKEFESLLNKILPRILTQASRDPNSEFFGCFDRNWWHYKMRDFPSLILQQGGYFCFTASNLNIFLPHQDQLKELAIASILFWNNRAKKYGAFEEYYPWEKGYPPLAFSTLSIVKMVNSGIVNKKNIERGLFAAIKQLVNRFEAEAGNQQVAGLAALEGLNILYPDKISKMKLKSIIEKTMALQNDEGWFYEYDGPDLGYLSVTIDCLWDIYDFTNDLLYIESARKALKFIYDCITYLNNSIGMHNARNTDYIVPYGIFRFLKDGNKTDKKCASTIIKILYRELNNNNHFVWSIDDRYWCHYIGHSFARALKIMDESDVEEIIIEDTNEDTTGDSASNGKKVFNNAGFILSKQKENLPNYIISLKKGGCLTLNYFDEKQAYEASNFGWLLFDDKQYVMNWWNNLLKINISNNEYKISGYLVPHTDKISSPFKHIILRIISFFLGYKIIAFLKTRLIFKELKSKYLFNREIIVEQSRIIIKDKILNVSQNNKVIEAPRASKRHVASADTFNKQDFTLNEGFVKETATTLKNGVFSAITEYRISITK